MASSVNRPLACSLLLCIITTLDFRHTRSSNSNLIPKQLTTKSLSTHLLAFNSGVLQGSMLLSLRYLVGTVVVLTGLMMAAKRYVDINICVPIARRGGGGAAKPKKKKKKGSLGDSLAVLRGSPMILNLALLVVSYGVSHRLFEFAWKGQLRALYPSAQAYQVYSPPPPFPLFHAHMQIAIQLLIFAN